MKDIIVVIIFRAHIHLKNQLSSLHYHHISKCTFVIKMQKESTNLSLSQTQESDSESSDKNGSVVSSEFLPHVSTETEGLLTQEIPEHLQHLSFISPESQVCLTQSEGHCTQESPEHSNHELSDGSKETSSCFLKDRKKCVDILSKKTVQFLLPDKVVEFDVSDPEDATSDVTPNTPQLPTTDPVTTKDNRNPIVSPPRPQQILITEEQTDQKTVDEYDDHKDLLTFLRSSKKENENLPFRKRLLLSFFAENKAASLDLHFHEPFHDDPLFVSIKENFKRTINSMKKSWKVDFCAEMLTKLWILLDRQRIVLEDFNVTDQDKDLKAFVERILERIVADKAIGDSDKRKRTLYKDNDTFTQDGIIRKERKNKWTNRIEPHPCPRCKHTNVITVLPDDELVETISQLDFKYQNEMQEYKERVKEATFCKNGNKRRSKLKMPIEPKRPNYPKQLMACMCCVSKCRNAIDGRGCHHCSSLSKNGIDIPYDIRKGYCECALCKCTCRIVFGKTAWQSIATDTELEAHEEEKSRKKAKPFSSGSGGTCMIMKWI